MSTARGALARTRAATGLTLARRDARLVTAGTAVAYLLAYLWAVGHLAPGFGGLGVTVATDPLATLLTPASGPLSFAPVVAVDAGPLTLLVSLNTLFGVGLAALVGLNLGLTYLAWRQPAACGVETGSAGLLAGLPALLSGTACCGPVVLLAVGVQASGALLAAFQWLLPVAVLALVGSLVLVGRQVDPAAL
jgi:hypothetical protein